MQDKDQLMWILIIIGIAVLIGFFGSGSYGMMGSWGMMNMFSGGMGIMWIFAWISIILFPIALILLIILLMKQIQKK